MPATASRAVCIGNDDDDDWCGGHCFQARLHPDVDDDLDLELDQVDVFG